MNIDIVNFITNNRNYLDLIIDLVPIPIFIKDRDERYIDCNIAFKNFLSVSREELIGKTAYDLWGKEEADIFHLQDKNLFNSGGIQIYETQVTSSDGKVFNVQFHKQVFTDSEGSVRGFLGAIFDITEKKLRIQELEIALHRVESLEGLLPICSWCKRMRENDSSWVPLEQFIGSRTSAAFTHTICPECAREFKENKSYDKKDQS